MKITNLPNNFWGIWIVFLSVFIIEIMLFGILSAVKIDYNQKSNYLHERYFIFQDFEVNLNLRLINLESFYYLALYGEEAFCKKLYRYNLVIQIKLLKSIYIQNVQFSVSQDGVQLERFWDLQPSKYLQGRVYHNTFRYYSLWCHWLGDNF